MSTSSSTLSGTYDAKHLARPGTVLDTLEAARDTLGKIQAIAAFNGAQSFRLQHGAWLASRATTQDGLQLSAPDLANLGATHGLAALFVDGNLAIQRLCSIIPDLDAVQQDLKRFVGCLPAASSLLSLPPGSLLRFDIMPPPTPPASPVLVPSPRRTSPALNYQKRKRKVTLVDASPPPTYTAALGSLRAKAATSKLLSKRARKKARTNKPLVTYSEESPSYDPSSQVLPNFRSIAAPRRGTPMPTAPAICREHTSCAPAPVPPVVLTFDSDTEDLEETAEEAYVTPPKKGAKRAAKPSMSPEF